MDVCLGFHAPRVDALIGATSLAEVDITVTQTLTISENAVLAFGYNGELLAPSGSVSCVGNPRNNGWNFVINRKGAASAAGMRIESAKKANEIGFGALTFAAVTPSPLHIQYTRFIFVDRAILAVYEGSYEVLAENCRFEWVRYGINAYASATRAKNCLFRDSYCGMYCDGSVDLGPTAELSTFDRIQYSIYGVSGRIVAKDCLFSSDESSDYGIYTLGSTVVTENFNGFYIVVPGNALSPKERSYVFSSSNFPYNRSDPARNESAWYLRGYYNNIKEQRPPGIEIMLEDSGSKDAEAYGLDGPTSVSRHAIKDVNTVDIGYHWPVKDSGGSQMPLEWQTYFNASSPTEDPDLDGVLNLDEYKNGTSPLKDDTDDYRYTRPIGVTEDLVGFDGDDWNPSKIGEPAELGFANGRAGSDLGRGPYIQITQWDAVDRVHAIYWGFDNSWWADGLPNKEQSFYIRHSSESQFTEYDSNGTTIRDCNTPGSSECFKGLDSELFLFRVLCSRSLLAPGLWYYKVRYREDPQNASARVVETPVYSFRVEDPAATSYAFVVVSVYRGSPPGQSQRELRRHHEYSRRSRSCLPNPAHSGSRLRALEKAASAWARWRTV